ncbi:hypothetical protein FRC03_008262, partial [Tulasnella sp. 419]
YAAAKDDKWAAYNKQDERTLNRKLGISKGNTVGYRQRIQTQKIMANTKQKKYWVSKSYNRNMVTHIDQEDFESLSNGRWLGTAIVEYMMDDFMKCYRESIDSANDLMILPSYLFFNAYSSNGTDKPHPPITITGKKALDFDFVAVPICEDDHWYLAVVTYISDLKACFSERHTAILIFDSLNRHHNDKVDWLKAMLAYMADGPEWSHVDRQEFGKIPVRYVPGSHPISGALSDIWRINVLANRRKELRQDLLEKAELLEKLTNWEKSVNAVSRRDGNL